MMKRSLILTPVLALTLLACKPPPEPPPEEVTPEMQSAVEKGFRDLIANFVKCNDMKAFLECHTDQAQAGLKALDTVVNPLTLDPSANAGDDKGAMWSCLLAQKAGFDPTKITIQRLIIDPAVKTAKVIFEIDGLEFGFVLARQREKWRSPFPGHVFLVNEYAVFANKVRDGLSDPALKETFPNQVKAAVVALEAYQPNWNEFPEMRNQREDDDESGL